MRITVLGKSPSWQDADGACSGYLVEEGGTCLLLDCGNGVFSKLRRYRDYVDVDAVVISHLHADHFLDLVPFAYALTYAPRQQPVPVDRWPGTDSPARPRLYAPRGARRDVPPRRRRVGQRGPHRERVRPRRVRAPTRRSTVGTLRIALPRGAALHDDVRGRDRRRRTAAGASPTAPTAARPRSSCEFADGADLLMIEATLPRPERDGVARAPHARRGRRARRRARASAASSSRTSPTSSTSGGRRREAEEAFGGPGPGRPRGRRLHGLTASRAGPRPAAAHAVRFMPPERDLFANFERMRREMDELFGDVFDRTGLAPTPARRLLPRGRRLLRGRPAARGRPRRARRASTPTRSALEIEGRELVIAGHRRPADAEGRVYQQLEIDFGPFRRVIPLGADVVADAGARDLPRRHPARRAAARARPRRARAASRSRSRAATTCWSNDDRDQRRRRRARGRGRRAPGAARATLPVLPLRETVPLPDTLTPLAIGQERSIQLVNDVLAGNRMLVMVAVARTPSSRQPGPGRPLRRRRRRRRSRA